MQPDSSTLPFRRGWTHWLSRIVAATLLFEVVSGLTITLGPFHAAIEWGLLLHTAVGIITLVPLAMYFVRHWKDYQGQALSDVLLLGYVGLVALAICVLSGVVLTWQGLFGVQTALWLRYTHLISTLAAIAATVPHIAISWLRRRADVSGLAAGWLRLSVVSTLAGLLVVVAFTFGYSGTKYKNEFPSGYNFIYGKDRPFAPSLARTSTNGAFDPRSLAGSNTCGASGCHTQIYDEWKPSAHRYAAMDPIFQGIQNVMAKQNGPESTRYCGGCHDPISLFSGTKNIFVENLTGLAGYKEGVSCVACHSIQKTDVQGNANYTINQPTEYLWQWSPDHTAGAVARNFLIRTLPGPHNRLSKRVFKKPEYCAACHKQFIDQEVNRVGWVQLQNQYDNWAASHWNKKGDSRATVECRECHMPLVESSDPASGDSSDYNRTAGDRKHRSHRFLAANNFVPGLLHLEGAKEHVNLTEEWLRGNFRIPEIQNKWADGPVVRIRLETPQAAIIGQKLPVRVILVSNKVGHDYPTGPLDMIQSWVELKVQDERGQTIFASGRRDERNFLEPGTFLFKAEPVDQYGNLIDRHNLWEMVGVRYRRSLFPGYSDTVEYDVMCPSGAVPNAGIGAANVRARVERGSKSADDARDFSVPTQQLGKLKIQATLHYRKIDQFLLNYVLGEKAGLTAPVVDIASAAATVCVSRQGDSSECR